MPANIEDLLQDMKSTKGSRFNAAKRLEGRDKRMALLIAMASALVIALTSLPFIYHLRGSVSGDLSALTLAMSVLILAVSELLPVLKTPRLGVFMEPEVGHGTQGLHTRVQG